MIVRLGRQVGFSLGTRPADDFPEGTGRGCHGDVEEPPGAVSNPACAAAVEPEGKLLEMAVEMFEGSPTPDGYRGDSMAPSSEGRSDERAAAPRPRSDRASTTPRRCGDSRSCRAEHSRSQPSV